MSFFNKLKTQSLNKNIRGKQEILKSPALACEREAMGTRRGDGRQHGIRVSAIGTTRVSVRTTHPHVRSHWYCSTLTLPSRASWHFGERTAHRSKVTCRMPRRRASVHTGQNRGAGERVKAPTVRAPDWLKIFFFFFFFSRPLSLSLLNKKAWATTIPLFSLSLSLFSLLLKPNPNPGLHRERWVRDYPMTTMRR